MAATCASSSSPQQITASPISMSTFSANMSGTPTTQSRAPKYTKPKRDTSRTDLSRSRERCNASTPSRQQLRGLGSRKGISNGKLNLEEDTAIGVHEDGLDERSLSVSDESGSSGAGCYDTLDATSSGVPPQPGTSPYVVPILDLIVSKRKSKDKAILDSWDVLPKPRSRVIIALEDEDQEFMDGWVPDSYVEGEEEERDRDGPLYSEVLRMGLDREREERSRKDDEPQSTR